MKVKFDLYLKVQSNSKVSSLFAGTQDKCVTCKKTVYPIEKVNKWPLCSLKVSSFLLASNVYVMNHSLKFLFPVFLERIKIFTMGNVEFSVQEISITLYSNLKQYDTFGSYKLGRIVEWWLRIPFFSPLRVLRARERKVSIIRREKVYKWREVPLQVHNSLLSQFTFLTLFPL